MEEVRKYKSHSRPAPTENHWASPAHPKPVSSTCLANGFDHTYPPVFPWACKWVSNSATSLHPQPRTSGRSTIRSAGRPTFKPASSSTLQPADHSTLKSKDNDCSLFNLKPKEEHEEEETAFSPYPLPRVHTRELSFASAGPVQLTLFSESPVSRSAHLHRLSLHWSRPARHHHLSRLC